jgi:hypothetical protein
MKTHLTQLFFIVTVLLLAVLLIFGGHNYAQSHVPVKQNQTYAAAFIDPLH